MRHLKTFENFVPEVITRLFSSKYIKKITSKINKIFRSNEKFKMLFDFSTWSYVGTKEAFFLIKQPSLPVTMRDIYIDIEVEKQWVKISIRQNIILDELLYIESLLISNGELMPSSYNPGFNQYFLTLSNTDIFIEKLTIDDFEMWRDTKKYNM